VKLIHSFGPNPRLVRMFLIEKGLDLPTREVDLMGGENRRPPYTDENPGGQMPALELDDGTIIGETVTICEYIEEKHPEPALIGKTPEERANTSQWQRRIELGITEHMYNAFRYAEGIEIFKDRLHCIPEAADGLKEKARKGLEWLDAQMKGRDYVTGDVLRLPDIFLFCCIDFMQGVGQPLDPSLKNLAGWYARMEARDSASKSLHPAHEQVGMKG
jgi:glutathione S-transferase